MKEMGKESSRKEIRRGRNKGRKILRVEDNERNHSSLNSYGSLRVFHLIN
jgi:hypothetical protein